eukprot:TRINITY_DN1840_c0_g1_i1.p1 TRINITY_DN1840_c0_g1~~TRINITY_DN1840_c0_g1_i1.p1  ORF type:complete len:740 (-),score=99.37 TRINITY_DN1840_c0_g1_i1:96-2315(-)
MFRSKQVGTYRIKKKHLKRYNHRIGQVKQGITTNKEDVAVRIVSKELIASKPILQQSLERELAILKFLKHPNIINIRDFVEDQSNLYIISDFINGTTLADFIRDQPSKKLNLYDTFSIFLSLIDGLDFCHSHFICHRELNPETILISLTSKTPIIVNFEQACFQKTNSLLESKVMEPKPTHLQFSSPELLSGKPYNGFKSDVWSCGLILYYCLAGQGLYTETQSQALLNKMVSGNLSLPNFWPEDLRDLFHQLLNTQSDLRPSLKEVKRHPCCTRHKHNMASYKTVEELIPDMNPIKNPDNDFLLSLQHLGFGSIKSIQDNLLSQRPTYEQVFYQLLQDRRKGAASRLTTSVGDHRANKGADLDMLVSLLTQVTSSVPRRGDLRIADRSQSPHPEKPLSFAEKNVFRRSQPPLTTRNPPTNGLLNPAVSGIRSPISLDQSSDESDDKGESDPDLIQNLDANISREAVMAELARWSDSWIIDYHELAIGESIGSGSYGDVNRGTFRGFEVAIKSLKPNAPLEDIKAFAQEVKLMSTLVHPNIIMFVGACTKEPHLLSVSGFEHKGSLYNVLRSEPNLEWKLLLKMALDGATGMCYLHSRTPPIIHRDLKSLNLLVSSTYTVKVADFGLSKFHDNDLSSKMGTLNWVAPEVLSELVPYGLEADVFSYGIILWEILTKEMPYNKLKPLQIVRLLDRGERPPIPAHCDPAYKLLITDSWAEDFTKRPSFQEIENRLKAMLAAC